jgi:hypothetical protein
MSSDPTTSGTGAGSPFTAKKWATDALAVDADEVWLSLERGFLFG